MRTILAAIAIIAATIAVAMNPTLAAGHAGGFGGFHGGGFHMGGIPAAHMYRPDGRFGYAGRLGYDGHFGYHHPDVFVPAWGYSVPYEYACPAYPYYASPYGANCGYAYP